MRDRMPSVADSDLATMEPTKPPYSLENTSNPQGEQIYYPFLPDYKPKPFAGMQRFFRYTIGFLHETGSPRERTIKKPVLQNQAAMIYQTAPIGKTVPLTYFVANPNSRWEEGPVGSVSSEPPEINQGGVKAYLNLASSITRRR